MIHNNDFNHIHVCKISATQFEAQAAAVKKLTNSLKMANSYGRKVSKHWWTYKKQCAKSWW